MPFRPISITGGGFRPTGEQPGSSVGAGMAEETKQPSFFNKTVDLLYPGKLGIPKIIPKTIGKALNLPSNIVGGAIEATGEFARGEYQPPSFLGKLGKYVHPGFVGAARGVAQDKSVLKELPKAIGVKPESAAGLGIGLAGEILTPDIADAIKFGDVAKTILGKSGTKIKKGGEELILRALKPSKTQIRDFEKATRETLVNFMTRHKLTDNFVEVAASKVDELQSGFDEIAIKSGRMVTGSDIFTQFSSKMSKFDESIIPSIQTKSKDVKKVFNNLINKYFPSLKKEIKSGKYIGEVAIDVKDLTKERRAVDKFIKEYAWKLQPQEATYLVSVRHAIQETIQKATSDLKSGGKTLKELGAELNKLYEFSDIAGKQQHLGKGTNIFGFLRSVGAGTGGAIAGIPGAIGGFLVVSASKSPKVIGGTSKLLQSLGSKAADSKAAQKAFELILRTGKEGAIKIPSAIDPTYTDKKY